MGDLRFGVIGCGGMAGEVHCPNLSAIAGTKLVAYCDISEDKAEALLRRFGGEYSTGNAQDIFDDPSIDGVLIQVGPAAHAELVPLAARSGKHIFVEKPIAIELKDALAAMHAVEDAGVKFMYGTCNRLAPMVRLAKRMCPDPVYSYCQCSDSITSQACHNLDLAVNLFHKSPLVSVYAVGGQVWGLDPHLNADSFIATLNFANGSHHCSIQHGLSRNGILLKYHYQLFGKDGCVHLAKRFKECSLMDTNGEVVNSWSFNASNDDRGPYGYMGHYDELAEWVHCIRSGQGNGSMTVRDAAYVLAVEKAILAGIACGQPIDFEQFLDRNGAGFLYAR